MSSRRFLRAFLSASIAAKRLRSQTPLRIAALCCGLAALGVGGCAQSPQQIAATTSHSKEYFPSSVYGRISPRVIADGQPVPRGGGQYLVGRPYTIAGQTYYPSERRIVQVGTASWYGDAFHGRLTANGEVYDRDSFTAAHPTMPLPSYARVTNLRNNSSMIVRVNDRGPYASNRVMDVSRRVAEALDFKRYGTARIKVEYVGRASLAGSDDRTLLATLRTDGPARWQGDGTPVMVADSRPPARVASLAAYAPVERPDPVMAEPPLRRREPSVPIRVVRSEAPPRFVAPPVSVAAAYRRFGAVHEVALPSRVHGLRATMPEREVIVAPRPVRLAAREAAHLPIRDLLPPPRFDRHGPQAMTPPMRPSNLAIAPALRHRVVEARSLRYRDD